MLRVVVAVLVLGLESVQVGVVLHELRFDFLRIPNPHISQPLRSTMAFHCRDPTAIHLFTFSFLGQSWAGAWRWAPWQSLRNVHNMPDS